MQPAFRGFKQHRRRERGPGESSIQIAIRSWLLTVAPDLLVGHAANGELRNKRTAAKLKAMGVYPGWPDLQLIDASGRLYFLEVKAGEGQLSDAQEAFRDECIRRCIPFAVVRSIDDARTALEAWGLTTREAA